MKKILIVDDEFEMRQLLKLYLLQESYFVEEAEDGRKAYEKIMKDDYDLIILDVMMPLMDGWETLKHIRGMSEVPVMMLTAKGTVRDKVTGLTIGADDYLVKPFDEEELMARVNALLRRAKPNQKSEEVIKYKGLILNLSARELTYQGSVINLTQTEFDLCKVLIEHKGKALTREQLVELIWGIDFMGDDRTVDSHIKNLREKLKGSGINHSFIKTVWGIGYKVE
jgi:two-component system, OmpR family, response regulator ResD